MNTTKKLSKVALAGILASVAGLNACKDNPRDVPREVVVQAVHASIDAKLDPNLTSRERSRLVTTVADMLRADLNANPNKGFAKVFGGTNMAAVGRYMDERIDFMLSRNTDPYEKLFTGPLTGVSQSVIDGLMEDAPVQPPHQNSGPVVGASNMSIGLFYSAAIQRLRGRQLYLDFGGRLHPVTSTRIGVMQVDRGFTDIDQLADLNGNPAPATWVHRSSILVHEARHSDCTGGVTEDEIRQIETGGDPVNQRCGHIHDICPATYTMPDGSSFAHSYAGVAACDSEPYGSYGVELVYTMEVALGCRNCGEAEKQQALVSMADRMMRFRDAIPTINGSAGNPDMSSQGIR